VLAARHAEDCSLAAAELQSLLRMLGASPGVGASARALGRGWIAIEPTHDGDSRRDDDQAILAEAERGEQATLDAYRGVLGTDLTPEVRSVVELQREGARRNADELRALRRRASP
jgi:uncharacterized protein (TIGR02284 family)